MNEEILVSQIRNETGISDFENMSTDEALKIIDLVGQNRIQLKQIDALVSLFPEVTKIISESLSQFSNSVNNISANHNEMLKGSILVFQNTSTILNLLASQAESDEIRLQISKCIFDAGDRYHLLVDDIKEINKDILKSSKMNMIASIAKGVFTVGAALIDLGASYSDDDDDFTIGICLNTEIEGLGGYEEYNISCNSINDAIEDAIKEYADEVINSVDHDDIPDEVEIEIFAENDDDEEEVKAVATIYFSNGSYSYDWRWE